MTTRILPDTETIVVDYLLTRTEVTDLVVDRIGTLLDLTGSPELPLLRIQRAASSMIERRHLRAGNVQVEAWGNSMLQAQDLLETTMAVLLEDGPGSIIGTHDPHGVVTATEESLGPRPFPDPETLTPRWTGSVLVYAHPIPA